MEICDQEIFILRLQLISIIALLAKLLLSSQQKHNLAGDRREYHQEGQYIFIIRRVYCLDLYVCASSPRLITASAYVQ